METRKKFVKAGMLALMVACLPSLLMAQKEFRKWPKGCSPQEVGELVSQRFVAVPHPNFNGNPAPPNEITYPETCAWDLVLCVTRISPKTRNSSANWKNVSCRSLVRNADYNPYRIM